MLITDMEDEKVKLAREITEQIEKFLKACKEKGDKTIDEALKRLEELKKET